MRYLAGKRFFAQTSYCLQAAPPLTGKANGPTLFG